MDWLTFTAEIVKAAAWPAVAVVIALIFRSQLGALMARLSRGRLGPAEFEFEQQLKVLAARSAKARAATSVGAPGATAAVMPDAGSAREAIMGAWHGLEEAARAGMQQRSAQDMALYRQLGALRDQVQHTADFQPSPESVNLYVQLAQSLQARLEGARGERGKAG